MHKEKWRTLKLEKGATLHSAEPLCLTTKMMKTIVGILLSIVLFGCNSEPEKRNPQDEYDPYENEVIENETDIVIDQNSNHDVAVINNEDGPPFSDTCKCSFNYLGGFNYNKSRYDLLISGTGWNPEYWSCTFTFGELISNEFPPDTLITDFRIHLVDLQKINKKLDSAFFESAIIQENLMATQRLWPGDEYTKCKFDPNKTGKYPKPKQWIE